ncbi:MAG: hypothetical protein U0V64_01125 [Cyclobacteriaceae bacterium]
MRPFLPARTISAIALLSLLTACSLNNTDDSKLESIGFLFTEGLQGWTTGFSDYPADLTEQDSLTYEMLTELTNLPAPLDDRGKGIRLRSMNRSDDVCMFARKKLVGLNPASTYRMSFAVQLASNVPTNATGAGGAPGESVVIKLGVSNVEPKNTVDMNGYYRLNIDKGSQSVAGKDVVLAGNVGVNDNTNKYTMITRYGANTITVKPNAAGELWLFVATDSGYEGLTDIYLTAYQVTYQY